MMIKFLLIRFIHPGKAVLREQAVGPDVMDSRLVEPGLVIALVVLECIVAFIYEIWRRL